jgi:predicted CoA-binding protein
MPTVAESFLKGRLSYSKVREVTRVVDVVDEQRLCELALTATASQLARMISGFRSADGMRISRQTKRKLSWHEREDGIVEFRARLPKDEADQQAA